MLLNSNLYLMCMLHNYSGHTWLVSGYVHELPPSEIY